MSRDQLQQVGAVMASHVDMLKGFLGDQFAVSIIARHKSGPFHLLLGDDPELTLIQCLSELQRIGVALVKDGEAVTDVEPTVADLMFDLLREAAIHLRGNTVQSSEVNAEFAGRIEQVLAQCPPGAGEGGPNDATLDAYAEQLTEGDPLAVCDHPDDFLEPVMGKICTYECGKCGAEVTVTRSRFRYRAEDCPGHLARDGERGRCRHCGTHVDEERPEPEDRP